jgi:hypothetical protein
MFSNNALHVLRDGQGMPADRAAKLDALISTARAGLGHKPVTPTHLAALPGIDHAFAAPRFSDSWSQMRDRMREIVIDIGQPADRYVMIGDTSFEREWAEAAQMAGYLNAAQFFGKG